MLGGEVEEPQQFLGVVGDLGHGLGPLDAVVTGECLDGTAGLVAVGCVADLGQRLARAGLAGLGRQASTLATLWTQSRC